MALGVVDRLRGSLNLNRPPVSMDMGTYGEWINSLGDWKVWGTMTFRPPEKKDGTTYTRRGRAFAWGTWRRYRRQLESYMHYWTKPSVRQEQNLLATIAVMELHESGVPHIHWLGEPRTALDAIPLEEIARTWRFMSHVEAGHSKVDVLEGDNAIDYVAKYIAKDGDALVKLERFDGKEIEF